MPTVEELRLLQALPIELKVMKTQQRIREWVEHFGTDGVYVSFSGGKDSTVLLHLVRKIYHDIEAVFVDTGLEYPEIRDFVKSHDNVKWLKPAMNFKEVIKKYGYPVISKEVAERVYNAHKSIDSGYVKYTKHYYEIVDKIPMRTQQILGVESEHFTKRYDFSKYRYLLNVDFKISHLCCSEMKKKPLHKLDKKPMVATMTEESALRRTAWLKTGCNSFDGKKQMCKPMSFWTEQDVLLYIKQNDIKIASVYGEIVEVGDDGNQLFLDGCGSRLKCTGCQRTGCVFCLFSAHNDTQKGGESRFVRLKRTHPKLYDYCMRGGEYDEQGMWVPSNNGLGMAHVIDELNRLYSKNGKLFIEY